MDAIVSNPANMPPQRILNGLSINADLTNGPYFIDGFDTIPKLFQARCAELGERTAHREKDFWHLAFFYME